MLGLLRGTGHASSVWCKPKLVAEILANKIGFVPDCYTNNFSMFSYI